jgi:hypothetical protein
MRVICGPLTCPRVSKKEKQKKKDLQKGADRKKSVFKLRRFEIMNRLFGTYGGRHDHG